MARTLHAAKKHALSTNRIIFEVTEQERVVGKQFLIDIFTAYRKQGFKTAIDDLGEG